MACEPAEVEEMGLGLSDEVEPARSTRRSSSCSSTVEELRTDAAYAAVA